MNILGVGDSSDSASVIIKDGRLVFGSEEERYTYKRHVDVFPHNSIRDSIDHSDEKIDHIVYGMDHSQFETPSLMNYSVYPALLPKAFSGFPFSVIPQKVYQTSAQAASWALYSKIKYDRIRERRKLERRLGVKSTVIGHHLSHASASYRCSGMKKANILVLDGSGERDATSMFAGNGTIEKLHSIPQKHSLGRLYTILTCLIGMDRFSQGKTMGLAPYGKYDKRFEDIVKKIRTHSNHKNKGHNTEVTGGLAGYSIDMNHGLWKKFKRYGGAFSQAHKNIAYMLQKELEDTACFLNDWMYDQTGYRNLCVSGGVALNCQMNQTLLAQDHVDSIFVSPVCSDAGTSLGAALEYQFRETGRNPYSRMTHAAWGPCYSDDAIKDAIDLISKRGGMAGFDVTVSDDICGDAAEAIGSGDAIGWFQGRMEFGPRALGNRSILADPTKKEKADKVNDIKHREKWRPLAPSVCEDEAKKFFEPTHESPFMNLSFDVKKDQREAIQGVTHTDNSSRIQTVEVEANPLYYRLLKGLKKEIGVPVVMNTSFNDRGQAIVRTPTDAIESFIRMNLDELFIGNYILKK